MTDSGFHVYFWRLLIFRWTLYKADISIKRTLLSCTSGVHLRFHCGFLKDMLSSIKDTSTHYWFLFSKFHNYRNWGGEESSSQNERTLGGGGKTRGGVGVGARKQTRANKGEGGQNSEILSGRTFCMSP